MGPTGVGINQSKGSQSALLSTHIVYFPIKELFFDNSQVNLFKRDSKNINSYLPLYFNDSQCI